MRPRLGATHVAAVSSSRANAGSLTIADCRRRCQHGCYSKSIKLTNLCKVGNLCALSSARSCACILYTDTIVRPYPIVR
eukprot:1670806-Pleurochrysis_carterae.AAC.1